MKISFINYHYILEIYTHMDFGFFETRKDYFDLDNSFILVHHQGKEMLVLLSDLLTHRIIEAIRKRNRKHSDQPVEHIFSDT